MEWLDKVKEIKYFCKADDSYQPALVYGTPEAGEKRPLLVGLHTWSIDYNQGDGGKVYAQWCIQNDWLFIYPAFRGVNNKPEAMGSDYVVSDILDAVEYMKEQFDVDAERIYLIGASGGGHAALLMAGRHPDIWAGVSAWCGISDIGKWWQQCKENGLGYADMIEACCGANPSVDREAAEECAKRSPLTYLKNAKSVNLDINAGVTDGRTGSVPFSHSLYAFNEVAADKDKIPVEDIESYYENGIVPVCGHENVSVSLYGSRNPIFVKISNNARVVVFNGGHDIVQVAALNWLNQQRKGRAATWLIENPILLSVDDKDIHSGK